VERAHNNPLFDVPKPQANQPVLVHPTAIIEKGATLGSGVVVGAYSLIGKDVILQDQVRIGPHVTVEGRTTIGPRNVIYQFASIGVFPQDLKYEGEDSELVIGEGNSFRQYVNISIGSKGGGNRTVIGNNNLFMAYVHVAHDCQVRDHCIVANGVSVAGHVLVDSHAVIGGHAAIHQFCHVGQRTMIAGGSMVVQDVPPFCMVHGDRAVINGLNVVGLKRSGITGEALRDIKEMYRFLYKEGLTKDDAVARMEQEIPVSEHREIFVSFLKASERGVCR
jgi:UDP-N-acetylglucosamine acyltransferase